MGDGSAERPFVSVQDAMDYLNGSLRGSEGRRDRDAVDAARWRRFVARAFLCVTEDAALALACLLGEEEVVLDRMTDPGAPACRTEIRRLFSGRHRAGEIHEPEAIEGAFDWLTKEPR